MKIMMLIERERDVIPFNARLREYAVSIGMGLVDQTKIITAASELLRNMLAHATGGQASIQIVTRDEKTGLELIFTDNGPGIPEISVAMQDGYSTGKTLGIGLPTAKRLVSEFGIESEIGKGTTVTIIKWKS